MTFDPIRPNSIKSSIQLTRPDPRVDPTRYQLCVQYRIRMTRTDINNRSILAVSIIKRYRSIASRYRRLCSRRFKPAVNCFIQSQRSSCNYTVSRVALSRTNNHRVAPYTFRWLSFLLPWRRRHRPNASIVSSPPPPKASFRLRAVLPRESLRGTAWWKWRITPH